MTVTEAERLRRALAGHAAITEKRMFGGICFLMRDHMLCAGSKRGFMFRVGAEREAEALARPGARIMEMRGRRMHGFVRVDPAKCRDRDVADWVALAADYVASLPPKTSEKKAPGKAKGRVRPKRSAARVRSARPSRNPPAG